MGADVHLYLNHQDLVRTLLEREPRPWPKLRFGRRPQDIFSYELGDFEIDGYDPHAHVPAPVAV